MANQLNTSVNSIVDYLNKKGEDSSFEARKRRYESLGFNQSLGDFRGSAQQNTTLLKALSAPQPEVPPVAPATAQPTPEVPIVQQPGQSAENQPVTLTNPTTGETRIIYNPAFNDDTIKGLQGQGFQTPEGYAVPKTATDTAKSILEQASAAAQPGAQVQQQFKDVIPPKVQPSAEDILAAVRSKTSTQLEEEAARLAKEDIGRATAGAKSKAESEKQAGYEKLQSRGLIRSPGFAGQVSGAAEAKVQEIDADKISKELGVDIKLAKIIARGIEQELNDRSKAEADKTKAEDTFLQSQGLIRNPVTGDIIPRLADIRAEESADRAMAAAERAERSLQLSEARFASEEDRRESAIVDDSQSVLDGIIGIGDVPGERRGVVIQRLQGFLRTPSNNLGTVTRKLELATDLSQPIELTDDEIRMQVLDEVEKNSDLNTVTKAINTLPISNRDRAIQIANEVFAPPKTEEGGTVGATIAPPITIPKTSPRAGIGALDFSQVRLPSLFRF